MVARDASEFLERKTPAPGFVENTTAQLRESGYVLIPDVLSADTCENLKAILENAYERYAPYYADNSAAAHKLNFHENEKIVYNLHNKDKAFLPLIDLPPVFDVVDAMLREGSYHNADPVIIRQLTARSPVKGKPAQQLHIDSRLPGCRYPIMAVVSWLLDDFTEENGGTRIVPGSHRYDTYPPDDAMCPDEVQICARKGSVLIMDAGAWHAGAENRTTSTRWCILSTYVRWFFKSAFDFNRNMPRSVYDAMTDRQKQLMGYTCNPPRDEFTRISARTDRPQPPAYYVMPRADRSGDRPFAPAARSDDAPWLIAVCAGRWQLPGIQAAMDAGMKVMAIDGDSGAPGLKFADASAVVDIRDTESVINAVREAGIKPAGAVSFVADAGMRAVAELREAFRLPGPGRDPVLKLTNKAIQRTAWDAAGLPNPAWRAARTEAEANAAMSELGLPAIVKPADSAGSRAVSRIDAGESWDGAVAAAFAASRSGEIIIESVLQGREFAVDTFSHGGKTSVLATTVKRKVNGTKDTVAMELATPSLPEKDMRRIGDLACRALEALDYTDGPGHVEIMFDESTGPALIEAAGRGGGFMVFEAMVPAASGFDLARETARQAVGLEPSPVPEERHALVLRFFPSSAGIVRGYQGFEKANRVQGVEAGPFVEIGQRVGNARSDGDRLGYILARGSSEDEAQRRADQAESLVRFEIEPAN